MPVLLLVAFQEAAHAGDEGLKPLLHQHRADLLDAARLPDPARAAVEVRLARDPQVGGGAGSAASSSSWRRRSGPAPRPVRLLEEHKRTMAGARAEAQEIVAKGQIGRGEGARGAARQGARAVRSSCWRGLARKSRARRRRRSSSCGAKPWISPSRRRPGSSRRTSTPRPTAVSWSSTWRASKRREGQVKSSTIARNYAEALPARGRAHDTSEIERYGRFMKRWRARCRRTSASAWRSSRPASPRPSRRALLERAPGRPGRARVRAVPPGGGAARPAGALGGDRAAV